MKRRSHPRGVRAALLGLLMALALAACGGGASAPADQPAALPADLPATAGRATDGTLTLVYWQAVSILNPHLATGVKDFHAASLVLEPLHWYDPEGNLVPALAAEVPTVANGGVAADLRSVTYRLREGVLWSDGTPFGAADVVFTWRYCMDPAGGCTTRNNFAGVVAVEAVDPLTVRITFDAPRPFPYDAFNGMYGLILQEAQFAPCMGAAAQGCSAQNMGPIGTGPYTVREFRGNDTVVYAANENYRVPDQPHFAEVVLKGGGDAAGAARAVLQTGEADFAWNLLLEPAVLAPMAEAGRGVVVTSQGGLVERILINFTNPDPALGANRSHWTADGSTAHPFLADRRVRQAMSMAIDRTLLAETLYSPGGQPTCNVLAGPAAFVSTANDACLVQDIEGAKALLEEAGWVDSDGDGVREQEGVELRVLYQTSTNSVRQKVQAFVQQWWQALGIATELKSVESSVFFGGDPASPDTLAKFYADVAMFANGPDTVDPQTYLAAWLCREGENIPRPENQFSGNNYERWCSAEYDARFDTLAMTADPAERIAMAKALNDLVVQDYASLPLVFRADVSAHATSLDGVRMNSWDSQLWNIGAWARVRE